MKRKIAATLAGVLVATGLTTALTTGLAATSATAASSGSAGSISHPDITLYKGQHNKTTRISYSVKNPTSAQVKACFDKDRYSEYGEEYTGWGEFDWTLDVEYFDRHGNLVDFGPTLYEGDDPKSGKVTSYRWYDWSGFGTYKARATVERSFVAYGVDDDGWEWEHYCNLPDATYADTFAFNRATYLSVNAGPEPVKKGKFVAIKGSLRYWNPEASYGDGAVRPLKGKAVKIYFDPAGSKGPVYKATARTDSKGAFKRGLKQRQSGTWIVKYAGTSTLKLDQTKDAVRVR